MTNLRSVFFLLFCTSILLYYQEAIAQGVESKLTTAEMSITIDSINAILQKNYIFPEVADKMAQSLKMNLKKGNYNSLVNPSEFARQLTKELYSVSNDRHLSVNYNPQLIAAEKNAVTDEEKAKQENQRIMELKRNNFGFKEVKILEGSIG